MCDREGTTGMGLNIGMVYTIETSLSIHERTCYACIAHLDTNASEEEEQKVHLETGVFNAGSKKVHSLLLLLSARVGIYDSRMNVS